MPPDPMLWDPLGELLGRAKPGSELPGVVLDPTLSRIHSHPGFPLSCTLSVYNPQPSSNLDPLHPGSPLPKISSILDHPPSQILSILDLLHP